MRSKCDNYLFSYLGWSWSGKNITFFNWSQGKYQHIVDEKLGKSFFEALRMSPICQMNRMTLFLFGKVWKTKQKVSESKNNNNKVRKTKNYWISYQKGSICSYDDWMRKCVSGLMSQGINIRIGRFLVQTQPSTWPNLETQPCYARFSK